jgi:aminoglycoside/choline kinase family phosphotransferase
VQNAAAPINRELYGDAMGALVRMQAIPAEATLPPYDEALLRRELDLFPQWYLQRHLNLTLDERQQADLEQVFSTLLANNLAQPKVLVHRDYHSRNLMVSQPNPGILDFQDAVYGPITYDLASLLRDAYVEWDEEVQIDYAVRYWERARKAGLPVAQDFADFWRDFEWMGLQRQLKVLGIFARLAHRDGKAGYLNDIPRVWRYAHRTAMRYRAFGSLALLLELAAGTQRQAGYTF